MHMLAAAIGWPEALVDIGGLILVGVVAWLILRE
jgi:hypothetical protein